jgi:hypothetical protein
VLGIYEITGELKSRTALGIYAAHEITGELKSRTALHIYAAHEITGELKSRTVLDNYADHEITRELESRPALHICAAHEITRELESRRALHIYANHEITRELKSRLVLHNHADHEIYERDSQIHGQRLANGGWGGGFVCTGFNRNVARPLPHRPKVRGCSRRAVLSLCLCVSLTVWHLCGEVCCPTLKPLASPPPPRASCIFVVCALVQKFLFVLYPQL